MSAEWAVVATDSEVRLVAQEHLRGGGDCVGAVAAGYFAACALHASPLLSSVSLLVGGVGTGLRAFDGRARQPGIGLTRLRRWAPGEQNVPAAARSAAPASVAAIFVAMRYGSSFAVDRVVAPALGLAKTEGFLQRAMVLDALRRMGAAGLAEPGISRPLIQAAGYVEGGALTQEDLTAPSSVDHPAVVVGSVGRPAWDGAQPWLAGRTEAEQRSVLAGVGACDRTGAYAVLCYEQCSDGQYVADLDLRLAPDAIVPRKGVTKIASGTVLSAPAPLSIRLDAARTPVAATIELEEPLRLGRQEGGVWG